MTSPDLQATDADRGEAAGHGAATDHRAATRLVDRWFPCAAVDAAVDTPAGSGLSEKALFTWFAARSP